MITSLFRSSVYWSKEPWAQWILPENTLWSCTTNNATTSSRGTMIRRRCIGLRLNFIMSGGESWIGCRRRSCSSAARSWRMMRCRRVWCRIRGRNREPAWLQPVRRMTLWQTETFTRIENRATGKHRYRFCPGERPNRLGVSKAITTSKPSKPSPTTTVTSNTSPPRKTAQKTNPSEFH